MPRIAPALLSAVSLALAAPALAALPVGAIAPDFSTIGVRAEAPPKVLTTAQQQRTFKSCAEPLCPVRFEFALHDALKRGPVVLYFYPAAFTPGCTIETHMFSDAAGDFRRAGATLLGVSGDTPDKLDKFAVEACRGKFPVAVATPAMIESYDVKLPQLAGRSNRTSYVIAKNGRVAYALTDMKPEGHIAGTLAAVRALKR